MPPLNWLDVAILAVAVAGAWQGYMRGLIGMAAGVAGYGLAALAAGRYAPHLVAWADARWHVVASLARALGRYVAVPPPVGQMPLGQAQGAQLTQALAGLALPPAYKAELASRLAAQAQQGLATEVAGALAMLLARGLVGAGAYVAILVAGTWGLSLLAALLGRVLDRVPVAGAAHRLLGAAVGAAAALAGCALALGVLTPLAAVPALDWLGVALAGSRLAKPLAQLYGLVAAAAFGRAGAYFLGIP